MSDTYANATSTLAHLFNIQRQWAVLNHNRPVGRLTKDREGRYLVGVDDPAEIRLIETTTARMREAGMSHPQIQAEHQFLISDGRAVLRLLLEGPKVLRLTSDQVDLLTNVDLTCPAAEFRLPFPSIAVQLPDSWRMCGLNPNDQINLVVLNDEAPYLAVSWYGMYTRNHSGQPESGYGTMATHTDLSSTEGASLERLLESEKSGRLEPDRYVRVMRLLLNAMLLMTTYGAAKDDRRDRLLKESTSPYSNRAARRQAKQELAVTPDVYTFDQQIGLSREDRQDAYQPDSSPDGTGRTLRPHWRRGHWANLAVGEGRAERRRVFRKPTMVRRDRFGGSDSDGSSTYRG